MSKNEITRYQGAGGREATGDEFLIARLEHLADRLLLGGNGDVSELPFEAAMRLRQLLDIRHDVKGTMQITEPG